MANLNGWSDEEYQKYLEQINNIVSKSSQITWRHPVMNSYEYKEEENIPLEQDEYGTYGYKVLIKTLDSQWFLSPNRFHNSRWINNKIQAHMSPASRDDACGIYASKNMDSLKEWWDEYEAHFEKLAYYVGTTNLFVVRIRVWGVVVEHTKGLRAEYAEILEVLKNSRW